MIIIDVAALADVLIQRLNPALPEGCWLERGTNDDWGGVWLSMHTAEGMFNGSGIAELDEMVSEDRLARVVEGALSDVQDDVAEATRGLAWPSDPASPEPLPEPWATIRDGVLSFGYGSLCIATDVHLTEVAL